MIFIHTPKHPIRYLVYVLLKYSYRCYIFIQQYELIFRYHSLFCVLLSRNTPYRSFSEFLTSLRISKVKGGAHLRFFYFDIAEAEQEVRSHNGVIRVFIVFLNCLRFIYHKKLPHNQSFLVFKTQKSITHLQT